MKDLDLTDAQDLLRTVSRRHFFRQAGFGVGSAALTCLINRSAFANNLANLAACSPSSAASPLAPCPPMFPATAKSIIYLFMARAPSQLDFFDNKPKLQELDGQHIPESLVKGERFAVIKGVPQLLGSPYQFKKCGQSGAEISDLLPHLMK